MELEEYSDTEIEELATVYMDRIRSLMQCYSLIYAEGVHRRIESFLDPQISLLSDTSYECWWSDDDEIGTPRKNVVIHQLGSEDFLPDKESLDLCFTSPPYFNTEEYDTAPTQSYIKFPTPELWFNDFLMKTVENCYYGLKRGAFLIINIANVKSYNTQSLLLVLAFKVISNHG